MNRPVVFGKWKGTVNRHNSDIGGFTFSLGEGSKITALLSLAGGMAGLRALPAEINDVPFIIAFSEDGLHTLRRGEFDKGLEFSFDEIDDLIQMVNACREVGIEILKHAPSAVGRQNLAGDAPDIIEGR